MVMLRKANDNNASLDSEAAHETSKPNQKRHALRGAGALAITLACLGLLAVAWERAEHQPRKVGHPEGLKAVAERLTLAHRAIEHFQQFAPNALILPLLDDTDPPRWTSSGIHWICEGRGKVSVDGAPLMDGAPVPSRPFSVRWDLHHCAPFAGSELQADGEVELFVTPEGTNLRAHIASSSLSLDTPAGRFSLPVISPEHVAAGKSAGATR